MSWSDETDKVAAFVGDPDVWEKLCVCLLLKLDPARNGVTITQADMATSAMLVALGHADLEVDAAGRDRIHIRLAKKGE